MGYDVLTPDGPIVPEEEITTLDPNAMVRLFTPENFRDFMGGTPIKTAASLQAGIR